MRKSRYSDEQIGTAASRPICPECSASLESTNFQFRKTFTDAEGNLIQKIGRFDINPADKGVIRQGPHLNTETQINGVVLPKSHIPIDPTTVFPSDFP